MAVPTSGPAYADPAQQGRLGQHAEEILHTLADLACRLEVGDFESEERRVLDVAGFAARQLFYLAAREDEVGRLCPAVEWELRLAESLIGYVNATARMWLHAEDVYPFPVSDDEWETIMPRMPRIEYTQSMLRLANFIRQVFPGDTAQRWRDMAQAAAEKEPPPNRMGVSLENRKRGRRPRVPRAPEC